MKKRKLAIIYFLPTFIFLLSAMGDCRKPESETEKSGADSVGSIYIVDRAWRDHRGQTLRLGDLAGTPVMAAFMYTHCPDICPRTVGEMRRIRARLRETAPRAAAQIRFLLISLDPEKDTPQEMRAFRAKMDIDDDAWIMIAGSAADTRLLAATLGAKYEGRANGQINHSNQFYLLDKTGTLVMRHDGFDNKIDGLLKKIAAL